MTGGNFADFSTVKYEIRAEFEIDGVVEKSDVVGAIFGQTEGLLGDELDIRELQRSGRIGRINVEMESKDGKTTGTLIIPSSLDRVSTAILAATIETVDRVGPCVAKFTHKSLEDVRKLKRDKIIDRATELLAKWDLEISPETQEITDKVSEARLSEDIISYGEENLPAGPEVETDATIVICEGRADVLNLLGIGVKNAIATNGTKIPKTIIELSKKKTTIAFLDGDRGGDMILNELLQVGKIDFVARAPPGREVEELSKKELMKALQNKVPYVNNQPLSSINLVSQKRPVEKDDQRRHENLQKVKNQARDHGRDRARDSRKSKKFARRKEKPRRAVQVEKNPNRKVYASDSRTRIMGDPSSVPEDLKNVSREMLGTTKALFYDNGLNLVKEVPTAMIVDELQKEGGRVESIVFDGIISQRLIDISSKENVKRIIGTRIGNVKRPPSIEVYEIDQLA